MRPLVQCMSRLSSPVLWAVLVSSVAGCGEETDRPSQIDSLRILAVRTDLSYAPPGAAADIDMLLEDGSPSAVRPDGTHRPVEVLWMGTCVNPPGDLYYNCYSTLHQTLATISDAELTAQLVPAGTAPGAVGFGTHFTAQIPTDIISSRSPSQGVVYPYGTLFLFYFACAGEIRHAIGANPNTDSPVACYRPGTDVALGQDDFEFGYYPIYAYTELTNKNPRVDSLVFSAASVATPCTDGSACGVGQVCGSQGVCIPVLPGCAADASDQNCDAYSLIPQIDESSAEPAASSHIPPDVAPPETIWVSYYATAGKFDRDSRVARDVQSGWSDSYGGNWRPKGAAGKEVRLYAVVRDNRGGVTWLRQDVMVQ